MSFQRAVLVWEMVVGCLYPLLTCPALHADEVNIAVAANFDSFAERFTQ